MSQDPGYPLGVSDKTISYPEPETCPLCLGNKTIDATPCCGSPFVENSRGYHCFRCHKQYAWLACPDCDGEGTL